MTDHINLEELRYAQAAAETGSFSAAARTYGVTQPALSNGIAKLEGRLGQRLFERTTRGVVLTAFGERVLPLIDRALVDLDALATEAQRFTDESIRRIRMGVSPLINPQVVARAFTAVNALQSPRELVLQEANMRELREALVTATLDLILIPAVEPLLAYAHRMIDHEPIVVVEPAGTSTTPVELAEFSDEPLLLVPDACGLTTFTIDLFKSNDLPINTYPGEALSYQVLEQWAKMGLGNAILPTSKLSSQDAPHRPLLNDGHPVEIFYESVWDGSLAQAAEIETIVGQIVQPSITAP